MTPFGAERVSGEEPFKRAPRDDEHMAATPSAQVAGRRGRAISALVCPRVPWERLRARRDYPATPARRSTTRAARCSILVAFRVPERSLNQFEVRRNVEAPVRTQLGYATRLAGRRRVLSFLTTFPPSGRFFLTSIPPLGA